MRTAVPALAVLASALVLALGRAGDLRTRPALLLAGNAALLALMLAAWAVRRRGGGDGPILAGALALRLAAAAAPEPLLSDDVHRYVWDGRVSLHGVHPYAHAPDDPELAPLRDAGWERINHRSVPTIYPPLAQVAFFLLAAAGLGSGGFRLALGLADMAAVLALRALLRRLDLPRDRLVLYAWNPLAILESAGSGHLEPLGSVLVLAALLGILGGRRGLSTAALAAAVHVKLLPAVLLPGFVRRLRAREVALLAALLLGPLLLAGRAGPAVGAGTGEYARRWEHNASAFALVRAGLERVDLAPALARWVRGRPALQPWIWPDRLARVAVAALALAWVVALAFRPGLPPVREMFLALAGVLVLSPVLHPWYLLWVLPLAAALPSLPWLLLGALAPLAYAGGEGEVPLALKIVEFGPPLVLSLVLAARRRVRGI